MSNILYPNHQYHIIKYLLSSTTMSFYQICCLSFYNFSKTRV